MKKNIVLFITAALISMLLPNYVLAENDCQIIYANDFEENSEVGSEFSGSASIEKDGQVLKMTTSAKSQNTFLNFSESIHNLSTDQTTFEMKFKMPGISTGANYMLRFDDGVNTTSANVSYSLIKDSEQAKIISFKNNRSGVSADASSAKETYENQPTWNPDDWVHVFVELIQDRYVLYINGQRINKEAATINNNSNAAKDISDIRSILLTQAAEAGKEIWFDDILVQRLAPITLQNATVSDGAVNIDRNIDKIVLDFNTIVNPDSLDSINISQLFDEDYEVSISDEDATKIVVEFYTTLDSNTEYTLNYGGVTDVHDTVAEEGSCISFTTVDESKPAELVSQSISEGKENVDLSSALELTFTKDIDPDSLEGISVTPYVEMNKTVEGKKIILTPNERFSPSTQYIIFIPDTVLDTSGIPIVREYSVTFKTKELTEAKLISTNPKNKAGNVGIYASITFTYSKDIMPCTGTERFGDTDFRYESAGKSIRFEPIGAMMTGTIYNIIVPPAVDTDGAALPYAAVQFTTTTDPFYVADMPGNAGANWQAEGLCANLAAISNSSGDVVTPDKIRNLDGNDTNDTGFHFVTGGIAMGSRASTIEQTYLIYKLEQGIEEVNIDGLLKGNTLESKLKFYVSDREIDDPTDVTQYTEVTDKVIRTEGTYSEAQTYPAYWHYKSKEGYVKYFVISFVRNTTNINYLPQISKIAFNTPMPEKTEIISPVSARDFDKIELEFNARIAPNSIDKNLFTIDGGLNVEEAQIGKNERTVVLSLNQKQKSHTKYRVSVGTGLTDQYNRTVDPCEAIVLSPKDVVLTAGGIREQETLPAGGTITPFVKLEKQSENGGAYITASYYRNGILMKFSEKTVTNDDFTSDSADVELEPFQLTGSGGTHMLKIIVRNNKTDLQPVGQAIIIK